MKKLNLLKHIIICNKNELLNAINSQKYFGITLDGKITFDPDNKIVIYKGKHTPKISALAPPKPITIAELLGENYKIVENENQVGIKATLAWQEIIGFNHDLATYNDTTGDGVYEFADKDLEDIGWHADEFEIDYRELIELIEEKCAGTLLCIEREEPSYQFSGLGFIDDPKETYGVLYDFCQKKVKEKIETDFAYAKENLSDKEEEAAKYFKVL